MKLRRLMVIAGLVLFVGVSAGQFKDLASPSYAQTIPPCVDCIYLPLIVLDPTPTPLPLPPPTPTPTPMPQRRLGSWVDDMRLSIKTLEDRHDVMEEGDYIYVLRDLFTTRDGSWDVSSKYGSIDQWARDSYLRHQFDDAGADHHLFAAVIDENGLLVLGEDTPLQFWSDGFEQLHNPSYTGYVYRETKRHSGWGNIVMFGSSYVPQRGESGPWCWTIRDAAAEVVCGGGMPSNLHISIFAVWQMVPR
jgi:hypothetical protein